MTNMARPPYVNIAEAKATLSNLVEKAAEGEEIVIARDHRPVARLVTLARPSGPRAPGSAKGKIRIAADLDEPLADFAEYER